MIHVEAYGVVVFVFCVLIYEGRDESDAVHSVAVQFRRYEEKICSIAVSRINTAPVSNV